MAAGARGPSGSERTASAREGHAPRWTPGRRWGPCLLLFHARSPGRRGLSNQPREGHAASTATNPAARPRPWATGPGPRSAISGPGAPRCARDLSALGPKRSGPRSADALTNGRADRRTRGLAGRHQGWRVAGGRAAGARAARPRKQRGPSAGPVRAAEKGGTDPDSEGTRRPGEAREGWRRPGRGRHRPARLPLLGPALEAPGSPERTGRPRFLPSLSATSQSLGRGGPQIPNPARRILSLTFCSFVPRGLWGIHFHFFKY